MFGLFESCLFEDFGQFFVCKHAGLREAIHAFLDLDINPTVVY